MLGRCLGSGATRSSRSRSTATGRRASRATWAWPARPHSSAALWVVVGSRCRAGSVGRRGRLLQRDCLRRRSVEIQHLDVRLPLNHPVRHVAADHFVDRRIDMRVVRMYRITSLARPHRLVLLPRQLDPLLAQGTGALALQHDRCIPGAAGGGRDEVPLVCCDAIESSEVVARAHGQRRRSTSRMRMISSPLTTARVEPVGGRTATQPRRSWERPALTSSRA
jgi:hypothetical protein